MSRPVLSDMKDFVSDLNGVVEDTLVRMGFDRNVALHMIDQITPFWIYQMRANMLDDGITLGKGTGMGRKWTGI